MHPLDERRPKKSGAAPFSYDRESLHASPHLKAGRPLLSLTTGITLTILDMLHINLILCY